MSFVRTLLNAAKSVVPVSVRRGLRSFRFVIGKPFLQFEIGDAPFMPAEAAEKYLECVQRARVYLEFGSGGSTVLAAKYASILITVESDQWFLRAVKARVFKQLKKEQQFLPLYVNIGITKEWGKPVFQLFRSRRKRYSSAPWVRLHALNLEPDFIFIDGRFRAACLLQALLHLSTGSECTIMFDDFLNRDYYRVVLPFLDDVRYFARTMICKKSKTFDESQCRLLLEHYILDPR